MIRVYSEKPLIDEAEVLRYLGYKNAKADDAVKRLISEKTNQLKTDCRVCFLTLPVSVKENGKIDFNYFETESLDLAKYIGNAKEVILFGATIGIEFDRLLKRETILSPSGAAVLQAVGACAIEELCDKFCEEFGGGKSRYSPGYGDLSISVQKDIFKVLNLEKNIGVTLTDSFLMTPTKSVTAFFVPRGEICNGCDSCDKIDCIFRKV